jgi:arylsulfatase A-like enzyme
MPAPTNVLFIIVDDHQADALGCAGHPVVRTPALDALASDGARMARAYHHGSLVPAVCSPARACLLTGRTPFQCDTDPRATSHRLVDIPLGMPTLPGSFRAAGYRTHLIGKWHNDTSSLHAGFTSGEALFLSGMCDHTAVPVHDFRADGGYTRTPDRVAGEFSTELFCGAARRFLASHPRDQPYFLYLSLTSPHDPRTPPEAFRKLYDGRRVPLPPSFAPEHPFDNGELEIRDETLAARPRTRVEIRRHLAEYYGMISHHDHALGGVFEAARARGDWENTLVVYVSDHGLAVGAHGLMGKQNLYEHSTRVPLLLRGPGVRSQRTHQALVQSFDLHPTVCELAGVPIPPGVEAVSFAPVLRGETGQARPEAICLYRDVQRMITDGRWKLITYDVGGVRTEQLFDLDSDPHETQDLSGAPSLNALQDKLRSTLCRRLREIGDTAWRALAAPQPP